MTRPATCKRCDSTAVAWVQSARTGRWYLAFRVAGSYRHAAVVYPQTPHRCDDPQRGGFAACTLCGDHHYSPFGLPNPEACKTHQDRKNQK